MYTHKTRFKLVEQANFAKYLMKFYGPKGNRSEFFQDSSNSLYASYINEHGAVTRKEIVKAMNLLLKTSHVWGGGDTHDREVVRDIMLAVRMGCYTAGLEFGQWIGEQFDWQVVD